MNARLTPLAIIVSLIVGGVLVFLITDDGATEDALVVLEDKVTQNEESIDEMIDILSELVVGNQILEEKLSYSEEARLLAQEEGAATRVALEGKIIELESTIEDQKLPPKMSITSVISEWSPRVARVECDLSPGSSQGSGTLTYINSTPTLITNSHVIDDNADGFADTCTISFETGPSYKVDENRFAVSETKDLGNIILSGASSLPISTPASQCSSVPEIGDEVVILGYPSVGSKESVTATEGIISGFDSDFYVTSAKIEQGASGGAAVHLEDNCLLGIPTLTITGRAESFARILKF